MEKTFYSCFPAITLSPETSETNQSTKEAGRLQIAPKMPMVTDCATEIESFSHNETFL